MKCRLTNTILVGALSYMATTTTAVLAQEKPVPEVFSLTKPEHDKRMAWWREAKFGMFIHWGPSAQLAGEWKGKAIPGHSEWIMHAAQIPAPEYAEMTKSFNPTKFDPDAWVQLALDAGMKYLIITAKHHDGFAIFDSRASDFNIVAGTSFKRDALKELAAACAKRGLKFGVYYSHVLDWHERDAGGPTRGYSGNEWDFPSDKTTKDFEKYFTEKAIPQVRELLTNYGPISLIWFDMPYPQMDKKRTARMEALVHSLQPDTIISGRLGPESLGEYVDYGSEDDNRIPAKPRPGDWETPATTNHSWGYKKADNNWRSPKVLITNLVDIVSKGGNYLLNVGPNAEGVIPHSSADNLREMGQWLKVNGEAIYGAGPTPFGSEFGANRETEKDAQGKPVFKPAYQWRVTTKPGKVYIHFLQWPGGKWDLSAMQGQVTKAYLLADPQRIPLQVTQQGEHVSVSLPEKGPDQIASVLCLETAVK